MTADELKQIRERCEAATPGPWRVYGSEFDEDCREHLAPYGLEDAQERLIWSSGGGEYAHPDMETAQFVAHARTDVPALLAEVERLCERVTEHQRKFEAGWDVLRKQRDEARAEAKELREVLTRAGERLKACSYELTEFSYQEMASVLFDLPCDTEEPTNG